MESNLKEEILNLIINDFGGKLTKAKCNQYVIKLKKYFVDYLVENKSTCDSLEEIFKFEFTRLDVINSTVYYVEKNESVTRKSAIDDFLIALNALFTTTINKRYFNQNLVNIQPFITLSEEIENIIDKRNIKKLKERESFPSISNDEYDFIMNFFKKYELKSLANYQYNIIIDLLLLYGFSFDKIIEIDKDQYSKEEGTLKIKCKQFGEIKLELPYNLRKLIDKFLDYRKNKLMKDNDYMFMTETQKRIRHGYLNDILSDIKGKFESNKDYIEPSRNNFTPTGIAKYAVKQMILEGMNQSIIMSLTGIGKDQYTDCQNQVNEIKNMTRNRYINHIIRGIATYDDI